MKTVNAHRLNRFFITLPEAVTTLPYASFVDDPASVHHVRNVLRLAAGDHLVAVDGQRQQSYIAEISELARDKIYINLLSIHEQTSEGAVPHILMGAALIKGQRWDWMLQKLTELGVQTIVPLETERAVVHIGSAEKKQERWTAVARSAAEQSEGLFIPRVEIPMSLSIFCERVRSATLKVVLLERGEKREALRRILRHHAVARSIAIAVGPEGGWSESEVSYLVANGFKPATLGDRILRSETAAITVMSALAYEFDTARQ